MIYLLFMKLKALFASLTLAILAGITVFQIAKVQAQIATVNMPISRPITKPITGPITSFAYIIGGRIEYRFLKQLNNINNFYTIPARNVVVKITNILTYQTNTVKTDGVGKYSLKIDKGSYKIEVSDPKKTFFTPNMQIVIINSNNTNINFYGVIKHKLTLKGFITAYGSKIGQKRYNPIYDITNDGVINYADYLYLKPILVK